ncbi:MAG: ketopantoate reductase family protein [Candidatus Rokuibacteriota bacterium]
MDALRMVIVGAGGVGGYFGARLAHAGLPVTLVARGAHLDAIQRDGLRVSSTVEGEYTVKVEAVEGLAGRPVVDVVLLCVKSFDTEAALTTLEPVLGPETAVLSLQNGVVNLELGHARVGAARTLAGAAYVFAELTAPGLVAHRFGGRIAFGELDGRITARAERLRVALATAGVPVEVSTEIRRVLWEKYLLICAQAGVTAVTGCPSGVVRAVPETWHLYRLLLEELAALAAGAGVGLAPNVVERILAAASALGPDTRSSLANDLAAGRRLELEALHGYAARLGQRLGVPTPSLFAVYAALKPHAEGGSPAGTAPARGRGAG